MIDADALNEILNKIPARSIENADGQAYTLVRLSTVFEVTKQMPTIEPKRKMGKWNTYYHSDTDFSYSCNQCGYGAPYNMIGGKIFQEKRRFCPNCGADMREEQDGRSL